MSYDPKEDARVFGEDVYVYCGQHMRPHKTGWCTASIEDKVGLEAKTHEDAVKECRRRGLRLFGDAVVVMKRETV